MSIFERLKYFFTEPIEEADIENDELYEDSEPEDFDEPKKGGMFSRANKKALKVNAEDNRVRVSNVDSSVLEYTPYSLNDMNYFIDALKLGKKVVLHLNEVDRTMAQRLLDVASGAAYALGCTCVTANDCECSYVIIPDEGIANVEL